MRRVKTPNPLQEGHCFDWEWDHGGSVRFGAGRGKVFAPRTAPHAGQGREIQAPPRPGTSGAPHGERGGGQLRGPPPGAPQRGPASIYGAPLFVTGPRPPSGAPPGSLFFAAPRLGPRFREPISL